MNKYEQKRDAWIKETQMFQRIAKVPETTYEALKRDYDIWKNAKKP